MPARFRDNARQTSTLIIYRGAMVDRFFNTDAFVPTEQVPKGVYGNAGRGLISGPALNSSDFSVIKEFVFREPYKVQFRSEFFNAFNQSISLALEQP